MTPTGWPKAKRRGRCITTGRGRFETGPYARRARGWNQRVSTGRGRLETGPYARRARGWGRGITTGRGRFETGPYAGGKDARSAMRVERPGRPRRLREYDYSQDGAYSVTICTDWRKHLFGRVTVGPDGVECGGAGGRTSVAGVTGALPACGVGCVCGDAGSRAWDCCVCGWGGGPGDGFGFRVEVGECDGWISTGRGRFETGPYARGNAGCSEEAGFETGPYARGNAGCSEEAGLKPAPTKIRNG